jgi:hypothetical protein
MRKDSILFDTSVFVQLIFHFCSFHPLKEINCSMLNKNILFSCKLEYNFISLQIINRK